ncbi:MAG: tetratricopeptide repeat protein [Planctomycetia bacterium]|jgi:tetratricopeptide (TPR) repeat protein|nr:tetratricopeptide repeat protein [Planctomycetia bacterium]
MFRRLTTVTIFLPLLLSSSALAQRDMDQIYLPKGAPVRGSIPPDGMTHDPARGLDKVTIDQSGGPRDIQVNEIVRITFAGEPTELVAGRNNVLQKNYNQALAELKKLDGQKIDRPFIKQDIDFYKALCQARLALSEGGDKKAAETAMYNFVRSAPQSYHFYEAAETLGDLAMASGKWADATKYYTGLAGAPWADYQMRANNASGRALIGEKQYDQAMEKFKAVLSSDLSSAEAIRQKNLATVGRAICLVETGKVDEAMTMLKDLIDKNDPQDAVLFARAYNALGRCYLKQNKPKDAVLALLHTDLLFYADADAHAEALYHLSKLWSDINKSDRAVAARNTLRERYAGSIWATLE